VGTVGAGTWELWALVRGNCGRWYVGTVGAGTWEQKKGRFQKKAALFFIQLNVV